MQELNFLDQPELYEPLKNSKLVSIIPSGDKIFYSSNFRILFLMGEFKKDQFLEHVILTDNGIAFALPFEFVQKYPILQTCNVNRGTLFYIPWYATEYRQKGIRVIEPTMVWRKGMAYNYFAYVFRIEKNKTLDQIKPYKTRVKEFEDRSQKLIEHSKEMVYNKLKPILSSYPQGEIPDKNPSDIILSPKLFTKLQKRTISELKSEKKEGTYIPNAVIKNIPRDTYYSKEKIIEEVKNCNFEKGRYELVKKIEDITIGFVNFLAKHSPSEAADLIIELAEVNDVFTYNLRSGLISYINENYPEREKIFYEFEKEILEKLYLDEDEHLIAHFKGKVNLPKAHVKFPGHIYITNHQLLFPGTPTQVKIYTFGRPIPFSTTGTLISKAVGKHTLNSRKKLVEVVAQNTDLFYFQKPYDIKRLGLQGLEYVMKLEYIEKKTSQTKSYTLVIKLLIEYYKRESFDEANERKEKIISKIYEFLLQNQ